MCNCHTSEWPRVFRPKSSLRCHRKERELLQLSSQDINRGGVHRLQWRTGHAPGKADQIAATKVLETWFKGRLVYSARTGHGRAVFIVRQGQPATMVVENAVAPVITSDGGGATAELTVAENTTAVTTVTADDPDAGQTPPRAFRLPGSCLDSCAEWCFERALGRSRKLPGNRPDVPGCTLPSDPRLTVSQRPCPADRAIVARDSPTATSEFARSGASRILDTE